MKILVAGIGNIFLGDDGFGCEVAAELSMRNAQRGTGNDVVVRDFGICSYDLAYAMTEGYDAVIMVDAAQRGEEAGTLFLIEVHQEDVEEMTTTDAHGMNPATAMQLARALGGETTRLFVVGCEPAVLETDAIGLSEVVREAIPGAVQMTEELIEELMGTRESRLRSESAASNTK